MFCLRSPSHRRDGRHLLCRVRTLSESEFARAHRLRDRCAFAAQFEGGGLRDARIDTPTPSWHVGEDLMSIWRKGCWCRLMRNRRSNMSASRFFLLDSTCGVGATLKLDRKIKAEHTSVISNKSEADALKHRTLVWGIRST